MVAGPLNRTFYTPGMDLDARSITLLLQMSLGMVWLLSKWVRFSDLHRVLGQAVGGRIGFLDARLVPAEHIQITGISLINAPTVWTEAALNQLADTAVSVLQDALVGALHHHGAVGLSDGGGIAADVILLEDFTKPGFAWMRHQDDMGIVSVGKLFQHIGKPSLRPCFFLHIAEAGHEVVDKIKLASIPPRDHGKDLHDRLRLVVLKDFVVIKQVKPVTVVIDDALSHRIRDKGNLPFLDRVILQPDILRARALVMNPFLEAFLGQLTAVRADRMALFYGAKL